METTQYKQLTREDIEAEIEACKETIHDIEHELRWLIRSTRVTWITSIIAIVIFAILSPLNIPRVQPILEVIGTVAAAITLIAWIGIAVTLASDYETHRKPINSNRNNRRIAKRQLAKLHRKLAYYDEQAVKHLTTEQYINQLPRLIASYRKRADRYRNWFVTTQLITIFLSAAITSLSGGWLDRYFQIPWVIPVISTAISILTSITLFFKFREKGTNLQQTADAMDWEHMACTLGIGRYKNMTREAALVELAEQAENLRKEQQKSSSNLNSPPTPNKRHYNQAHRLFHTSVLSSNKHQWGLFL